MEKSPANCCASIVIQLLLPLYERIRLIEDYDLLCLSMLVEKRFAYVLDYKTKSNRK